ncbi:FtsB family cell division protein [Enterococcus faecalis]
MRKNKKNLKKVAALNNDYTKEQYAEFQKQQKQLIFRRRRLAAIFMIAFVIFIFSGVQLAKDYHRLHAFKHQRDEAMAQSADIDEQVKKLKQDVALLKDDEYVAKLARSRLYGSKEGEQIYPIPELDSSSEDNENGTSTTQNSQPQSSVEQTTSSN